MNTFQNGTFSVIHDENNADFANFVYSAVYFTAAGPFDINGTSVAGTAGQTIPLIVKQTGTTLATGFLLLGNPKPVLHKTGKISGDTYQYVDIKTGNIIRT
ncbi:hypothetical protein N9994_00405 [bacterium]|nr:hypothetical protein [bacterium]